MESFCESYLNSTNSPFSPSFPKQTIFARPSIRIGFVRKSHLKFKVSCTSETMNGPTTDLSVKKSKEVKLWGGRFEESVTDAVEKFSESISFDKALYKQDIMGSKAHAKMLAHQGLMTDSDRDSILSGLDEIKRNIDAGKFVWRTDREDVHMNIEAALTEMVGEPAKKLHTARSRNDQVVTDLRLWCRDAIDEILENIKYLQVALVTLAKKNEGLIVPGYTHLQRAQPVLLQHLLLSYVEQKLTYGRSTFIPSHGRCGATRLGT